MIRQQWVVYHDTVRRLGRVGGLSLHGLDLARRDLRPSGRWQHDNVPDGFGEQAMMLPHDVAELLATIRGPGFRAYYVGAGDLLPPPPTTPPR
jgi:hypothetical protein